ncbi:Spo0B domain-containing protein [Pontibacillus yanchengensis]|uniref:Sporulation initiation phosphotransferase B C-terminal domain-containing protein n=1 Tax=Pontibacillus yanchengensis Y32 TaxID=1385514 RepID=A0A0A2TXC2_9BACI|nr:Spo0B domain-containing protein [Pontibacillus yanchengensis]KGP73895.1 hypothetical protein N782_21340 [Pontibacillus yanchengensis Y32]
MKVDEVANLLRHYRHDWMNQLQLVHGYASMDKMEKVKEKLQEIIDFSREESKLMNLKAPHFAVWMVRFNAEYNQFRMSYQIDTQADFSAFDQSLVQTCSTIIQQLEEYTNPLQLYECMITLWGEEYPQLRMCIYGQVSNDEQFRSRIDQLQSVQNLIRHEEEQSTSYEIFLDMNER